MGGNGERAGEWEGLMGGINEKGLMGVVNGRN